MLRWLTLSVMLISCSMVIGSPFDTPGDDLPEPTEQIAEQSPGQTDIVVPAPGVLLTAGDIADCDVDGDEATAKVLERLIQQAPKAVVAPLGDLVYPNGTLQRYRDCYAPNWGKYLNRTRAAQGNHDFANGNADGYYAYFGQAAGPKNKGYDSFDLASWRVIVLNSNCWAVGGCGPGSPQLEWLQKTLRDNPARCTLAYWHHPRYSSGLHGNFVDMDAVWDALVDAGVELVLSGHDHHFERFAPIGKQGQVDPIRGVRQFVVGTGGKSHYPALSVKPGSQVRNSTTFGVLRLSLTDGRYGWRFMPTAGQGFTDAGSGACH
jgi:3',5'-cyclic AMP phosphodiesterase CpdA